MAKVVSSPTSDEILDIARTLFLVYAQELKPTLSLLSERLGTSFLVDTLVDVSCFTGALQELPVPLLLPELERQYGLHEVTYGCAMYWQVSSHIAAHILRTQVVYALLSLSNVSRETLQQIAWNVPATRKMLYKVASELRTLIVSMQEYSPFMTHSLICDCDACQRLEHTGKVLEVWYKSVGKLEVW